MPATAHRLRVLGACGIVMRHLKARKGPWLVRNRHLRIDDERKVQTSETLVEVAMIRLLLRPLAGSTGRITEHALATVHSTRDTRPEKQCRPIQVVAER